MTTVLEGVMRFGCLWVLEKTSHRPLMVLFLARGPSQVIREIEWYNPWKKNWHVDVEHEWSAPFDRAEEEGRYSFIEYYEHHEEFNLAANTTTGILEVE
jgi:hypothetical protein